MDGFSIRKAFLSYFEQQKHTMVKSASLVPAGDPTLIFINAGMAPFKNVFLGLEDRDYTRATSSQKCMRVSGKHNDLEQVGQTARHHTFFEMLGNFSFGDYFKEEAIHYAWDFLTNVIGLDQTKLWATVYHEDEDAYRIWRDQIKISEDHIVKLGDKDNFWSMGDTGPCGPCSEILYDQGEEMSCGDECAIGVCDCDRYLEIWNLVFMQYNRDQSGTFNPLPKPCVDTGMGLERLAAVVQGKHNNYDSDLFQPIIQEIATLSGVAYGAAHDTDTAMRVIADHARSTTFLIADGVIPSNEARGYVLRRVMRRAIRFGRKLDFGGLFFHAICQKVIDGMGEAFPELKKEGKTVVKIVENEERKFRKTLIAGEKLLAQKIEELQKTGDDTIDGDLLFLLYDAFGFPFDLSELIAREAGFKVDKKGFHANLAVQRARSRANHKIDQNDEVLGLKLKEAFDQYGATQFLGYTEQKSDSKLLMLIEDGTEIKEAVADEEKRYLMITDQTPFYAESGGQVADKGCFEQRQASGRVLDVLKSPAGIFYHLIQIDRGVLTVGDPISLAVDEKLRKRTQRNHSATHLLQSALKAVVGDHVHQEGSLVDPDRLRFDFNHFEGLTVDQLQRIERHVNFAIMNNTDVAMKEMDLEEAKEAGAMALFTEKYDDHVRTVRIGDESFELCGGTHVDRSGDIGFFKIVSESSIASGIRRIEAVTGEKVLNLVHRQENHERGVIGMLKATKASYLDKVKGLVERNKTLERELDQLKKELNMLKLSGGGGKAADETRQVGDYQLLFKSLEGVSPKDLKNLGDELKQKGKKLIVCLVSRDKKSQQVVLMRSGDTTTLHCGNTLKALMQQIGGRGGGREAVAQGGAPLEVTAQVIEETLVSVLMA